MPIDTTSLLRRMIGAAQLDVATYEEVENDESATAQAALVVGIVAVAGALGAIGQGGAGIFGAVVGSFLAWFVWSGVTYLVGDKLLGGTATWWELLRTLGFAQSPAVLNLAAGISGIGPVVSGVVAIWTLVTGIVAIRQALDVSTGRAIATAILSWIAMIVMMILPALLLAAAASRQGAAV
jgi:hypothetical protein